MATVGAGVSHVCETLAAAHPHNRAEAGATPRAYMSIHHRAFGLGKRTVGLAAGLHRVWIASLTNLTEPIPTGAHWRPDKATHDSHLVCLCAKFKLFPSREFVALEYVSGAGLQWSHQHMDLNRVIEGRETTGEWVCFQATSNNSSRS